MEISSLAALHKQYIYNALISFLHLQVHRNMIQGLNEPSTIHVLVNLVDFQNL